MEAGKYRPDLRELKGGNPSLNSTQPDHMAGRVHLHPVSADRIKMTKTSRDYSSRQVNCRQQKIEYIARCSQKLGETTDLQAKNVKVSSSTHFSS